MKRTRSILLLASIAVLVLLTGGGVALTVGASDHSYGQAALFAEVLSLVMDYYVDPVEPEGLFRGAYEGMLSGLDANGAFLDPEEVADWKRGLDGERAGPGFGILKIGRTIQVVSVAEGSPAAEAGIQLGDHIRGVDGRLVRDLSLEQVDRIIRGPVGSTVRLELLHPRDGFRREELEVARRPAAGPGYRTEVRNGTAVLTLSALDRVDPDALAEELDDVRSRGVERLLVDLRQTSAPDPREVKHVAGLFGPGPLLRLRDRAGRQVEAVVADRDRSDWTGSISALVGGATAGAGEAVAELVRAAGGQVYGETTYGLGAEAKLYELENGCGLLISAELWETASGSVWNAEGVEPDRVVQGKGRELDEMRADQLAQVLQLLELGAGASPKDGDAPAEAA